MGQSIFKYITQDHVKEQRAREGFVPNPEYQKPGYDKDVLGVVWHGPDCVEYIFCVEPDKEA